MGGHLACLWRDGYGILRSTKASRAPAYPTINVDRRLTLMGWTPTIERPAHRATLRRPRLLYTPTVQANAALTSSLRE